MVGGWRGGFLVKRPWRSGGRYSLGYQSKERAEVAETLHLLRQDLLHRQDILSEIQNCGPECMRG